MIAEEFENIVSVVDDAIFPPHIVTSRSSRHNPPPNTLNLEPRYRHTQCYGCWNLSDMTGSKKSLF
jgi:hypothetical protein